MPHLEPTSPYNPVILMVQHFVAHKIFISINVHGDSVDVGGHRSPLPGAAGVFSDYKSCSLS